MHTSHSRKKLLEKLSIEEVNPFSSRYPGIVFTPEREAGDQVLMVEGLSKSLEGRILFENIVLT
ncbi:MAG: hypothetical protein NZM38_02170 [Cytophagales bacterium]|nr:hypothetical protein [Cytophagales bacterium]MDW8383558.1 hypothetical protein [Flammeovirgaceae bacterium]